LEESLDFERLNGWGNRYWEIARNTLKLLIMKRGVTKKWPFRLLSDSVTLANLPIYRKVVRAGAK